MANPLTAGTWQLVGQAKISGASIAAQGTATSDSVPDPVAEATAAVQQTLSYGTGSGQADILCAAAYTLTAGGSVVRDLLTGTDLPNLFGGSAAFAKLKGLFVGISSGGDAAGVTVGNTSGAGNPLTLWFGTNVMTWTVKPSGPPMLGGDPAGVAVDATHRNLRIVNNGAVSAVVVVALAGTSV